ncbi:phosphopantothenoylcysteine decarboxylase [Pontiellaceae bacterium B12219]|nr:phosphopantothenoylcysteine decarboxylase [Pontiellaceae bacterium B12219]
MPKHVLILSGPTHEYIDPVRFIGNASSGLMGKALAEEAGKRNCEITFISGPVANGNLPTKGNKINLIKVTGAEEMLQQAAAYFQSSDIIIFAAAVADYTPAEKRPKKMAKSEADLLLRLKATPDIAKTLCANKAAHQIAIGFALQTEDGETNARRKLTAKKLNGIVLNTPASLGSATGTFSFLAEDMPAFEHWGTIDKETCAMHILDYVL